MPPPVAARRIALLAAARATRGELLRIDPARLRFSLGTSIADVRVPVQVAPDAAAIARSAAAELAMLLATQHRRFLPADDLDRLALADGSAALPAAAATLGASGGGPELRAAAALGPALHPALTGGVVCAWMGKGGRGRSLTALFIEALGRALAERDPARGGEDTPFVVALALSAELAAAEPRARALLPASPVGRYLASAAMAGVWLAAATGLARAARGAERAAGDPLVERLEAVIAPCALLGGKGAAQAGATLYGCELPAGIPRGEELLGRLAAGADPERAIAEISQALAADDDLARRAEAAAAVALMRELLAAGIAGAEEGGRAAAAGALRDLYVAPGVLASAVGDDGARSELARRAAEVARGAGGAAEGLERAARALQAWNAREPGAAFGLAREAARNAYARAAGSLLCDLALERLLAPARGAILARTGAEAEGGAEAEWEAGRLYRISARPGPILNVARQKPLAHLFADVKDFTRRTGLLGPAAMAEFLRSEFYGPILEAAKCHFAGMPHLADRGGVAVNNLLGDAISFSGDVEALVALAGEIRGLLLAYEARLARQISGEAVARLLREVEARSARDIAEPAERARAVARARGEGLEAGVFLSFGAAPVTVLIEDDVFGHNRVAIAEKINESARGTSRAGRARARADAALAAERAARGDPALAHAWSVFVARPLAIEVPPDAERAALDAARAGDLPAALRALSAAVGAAVEREARGEGGGGEIYNGGAALSEEALEGFLFAVGPSRTLRRFELEPARIPESLRARWFYGEETLELVATFHPDGRPAELFRRVGEAAFKGLAPLMVWELAAGAPGATALVEQFAEEWRGENG